MGPICKQSSKQNQNLVKKLTKRMNILTKSLFSQQNIVAIHRKFQTCSALAMSKRWKEKTELPFENEFRNPVAEVYGAAESWPDDVYVRLYDKKPCKISVKKYHTYKWCGCGRSHSQPFCDTTCDNWYLKKYIDGGPITYIAPEDKEVWFCLCKRTKHRPFCDGSHRDEEIQNAVVEGKIELFEPFEKKKK